MTDPLDDLTREAAGIVAAYGGMNDDEVIDAYRDILRPFLERAKTQGRRQATDFEKRLERASADHDAKPRAEGAREEREAILVIPLTDPPHGCCGTYGYALNDYRAAIRARSEG